MKLIWILAALGCGGLSVYFWLTHDNLRVCFQPGLEDRPECFYSSTWFAARQLFRDQAQRANAELHTLEIGPNLLIDIAILRSADPQNKDLILHISGTHGVEGFAGSAIQSAFLHSSAKKKPTPTMVFVHGLNPFGMQHFRRVNEHNVDLNRNAMFDPKVFEETMNRDSNIAGYDDFRPVFNPPPGRAKSWMNDALLLLGFAQKIMEHMALTPFKRALVTGTYTEERGLFFGGRSLQPSHTALREFLDTHGFLAYKRVVLIDVHTGLGPFGRDTLMFTSNHGQNLTELFGASKHNLPPYRIECQDKANNNAGDATSGYDLVKSDIQTQYAHLFRAPDFLISMTQEFGTSPAGVVAFHLAKENQAWWANNKVSGRLNHVLKLAFSPDSQAFAEMTIARGKALLHDSVDVLKASS